VNRIVGLTGGIGAGKSTVAALLAELGAVVIDVDGLGRQVIAAGGSAVDAVVERFGSHLLGADGGIDRAGLASVVFADRSALAGLEAISHPAINREIDRLLDDTQPGALVVLDMAILLGSRLGLDLPSGRRYSTVVVVEAPLDVRIARLVGQRAMAEADARARIAAQPSDAERRAIADHVVDNAGDLAALTVQVHELHRRLTTEAG
jgi:dephospho-CoA kinase